MGEGDAHGLLSIEIKILDERVRAWGLPAYHSEMAAGIDLFACVENAIDIEPQVPSRLVSSGISVHIGDPGFMGLVVPRSGLGHRSGLVLGNLVGVIDADYTGPLMISVWNRSPAGSPPVPIAPGDRIAQLLFVPIVRPQLTFVEDFSRATRRGSGGFGSTGHAIVGGKPTSDE
jgi:dUTP pyrophosphatase